jgi:RND family efflux transporter MFP subunit
MKESMMASKTKTKKLNTKTLILTAVIVVIIGYIGWRIIKKAFPGSMGRGMRTAAVAVEIAPVQRSPIRDVGQFSGTLIPKAQFTVVPKISGRLERLLIDIGDTIRRGQLVAVLEDEEYQQQLIQAEADLRVARANLEEAESSLEIAKRDLERAVTLHEKGIQSDSQLDAARAQYEAQEARHTVAVAQLANRDAALETSRVRLSYTRITASWERGSDTRYVGEKFVYEGAMLSPNTAIVSIIELQPVTAIIHVTDKDYFRLGLDQNVAISSSAFPNMTFAGRVVRIAPLLKETSRQARVEVEIENPEARLKPGMFINAQIEFAKKDETTVIPYSALVNRASRQGVFLADLENMKADFVPVQVGIIDGEKAEILEPNPFSGHVVTLGHHLLEDGAGIFLPQSEPASKKTKAEASETSAKEDKKSPGGAQ